MGSIQEDSVNHDQGTIELDALVIGAGFHGVYLLYALRKAGFKAEIWDTLDGFGGVWRTHDYPGCRVDVPVPGYQYSMEELWSNWKWKGTYPSHHELRRYFDFVAKEYDMRKDVRFNTRVTEADFDIKAGQWIIRSANGFTCRAQFFLPCLGFISTPYVPEIKGSETFRGAQFHTARWPQGFNYKNRRIGVIGTSSTGTQLIEHLAPDVKHMTAELLRSYFEWRPTSFSGSGLGPPLDINATDVSPQEREAHYEKLYKEGSPNFMLKNFKDLLTSEKSNRWCYDFWRNKVHLRVKDPHTAEILAPNKWPHPIFAKRPSFENAYFELFNQPNVDLIDLPNDEIVSIEPRGIITRSSGLHEMDTIVYATGFNAIGGVLGDLRIIGTDKSKTLYDEWAGPDGKLTYLGYAVPGFPNMLLGAGPHSLGVYANGATYSELQGVWMVELLAHVRDKDAESRDARERTSTFDAKPGAAKEFKRQLLNAPNNLMGTGKSWQSGYNIPGAKPEPQYWTHGLAQYLALTEECKKGGYAEFVFE